MWTVDLERATHTAEHSYNSLSAQQFNEDDLPDETSESVSPTKSPAKSPTRKSRGQGESSQSPFKKERFLESSPWTGDCTYSGERPYSIDVTPVQPLVTPCSLKENEWLPPEEWTPAPHVRNQRSERGESMHVTPALMQEKESLLSVTGAPGMQGSPKLSQSWGQESVRDEQKQQLVLSSQKWMQGSTELSQSIPMEIELSTRGSPGTPEEGGMQSVALDIPERFDGISPMVPRRMNFEPP